MVEGEPERQVPALEPFLLSFLHTVRVGPVDELLAQAAQLGRVQARRRFRPGRWRGRIRRGSGSRLGPGEREQLLLTAPAAASSLSWPAARQIACAASKETCPAINAFPVAGIRRSARPVATSSPARPGDRPQPRRRNAAVEEYPASAAPPAASSAPVRRASSPWAWSMKPARSRT